MAVEPASASASASSSNAQATPTPGVRATTATTVIRKASEKVVGSINLKAMEQSFPDFLESEEDRQFIQLLTEKTGDHLSTGFEEAWGDLMTNSEYKDFTAKANQVDQVFAAATQRRARREPPQDAWKKGADPVVAIAAAVIPKLQGHLDSLRATSAELSEQAVTRQRAILDRQGEADAVEREITAMLRSIQEGAKNLSSIDQSALRQLSDSLIPLIRSDEL